MEENALILGFDRKIDAELKKWKSSANRKPLVLRGARQVGKTTAVKRFAVNAGCGPMLIPADVRVGWQTNFRKTDNGFIFKMELGFLPGPTGNVVTDEMVALTLGATYKF